MKLHTGRALALAFVAGTLALATPDPGAAQQRRGGGMFGGGEAMMLWGRLDQGFDEFAGTLSLTEAQKQLVTIVADDFREANADALARLTAMREELRGMFGGGSRPDRQAMQQIVQKHGNPAQELAPALETLKEDVTAVLDPEQVQRLTRLLAQRRPPGE